MLFSKNTYLSSEEVKDEDLARKIFELGFKSIADNPNSIPLFKDVDEEYLWDFIKSVSNGETKGYFLIAFRDPEDESLVGACLFSEGSPWYNPNITVVSEECTVAFKRGYGVTRAVADYLESLLEYTDVDVVMASSANEHCSKLIENTYMNKFSGFKSYKTYYKVAD